MKNLITATLILAAITVSAMAAGQTRSSVARILSDEGKGTGFFVTRNLVMTNHHVACEDKPYGIKCDAEVIVQYGTIRVKGKVVKADEDLDLALVFVAGSGPRPFKFCDSAFMNDEVEIWAYEYGFFNVKKGIVKQTWMKNVITTIGLIGGNSGSPLIKKIGYKECIVGVSKSSLVSTGFAKHVSGFFAKEFLDTYLLAAPVK